MGRYQACSKQRVDDGVWFGDNQAAQGYDTDQYPMFVDYVRLIDGLFVFCCFAQNVDGFTCRDARLKHRVIGAHQCAGSAFCVGQKRCKIFSILLVKLSDELFLARVFKQVEKINPVIRRHFRGKHRQFRQRCSSRQ